MIRRYSARKLAAFALLCAAIGVAAGVHTDSARARSNLPVPLHKYDGTYTGYLTLKTITSENAFARDGSMGMRPPKAKSCTLVDPRRNLMIKDDQFQVLSPHYNHLTGTVSNEGIIAASANSYAGGFRLNARIQGSHLVGEFIGPYCIFTLQMKKKE
jgi:hypothetical protein